MATVLVKNLKADEIKRQQPVDLFTGDDFEITDSFQDISEPVNVKGVKSVVLWVNYDRGDSVDMQIKALIGPSADVCDYEFVIETVSADKVELEGEAVEPGVDADFKFARQFILDRSVNFIKFQVKDSADGTGQIDSAKLSIGS
jgi:hypothetical protein